ncbi:MAG: D-alanyl-D-alanine carboxypeptidase [Roseicyclus sp.]|uniref:D-alanyl-D-alanine carboxypeptidase family protein n=1 Tax=Boseongicola sp. H5 TaxID=2763261 RepID=UPI001AFE5041|nr:D-alanyl-D-alanine carboxypeptidase family protein [Boseongicola sp. H5]MBO6603904.1 D-alanyl-D-alanine carboxypeptidase [Roseicyclus sp.]MBO6624864.1 D-alanyl-D-alanine carboxypeptidase [Roseicyclus sp.]MBO6924195.1 D-alanyl-D-alanine carboxypeptidase [Roseicyclus sp.]
MIAFARSVLAAIALLALTTAGLAFETEAEAAYVVDHNTGQVLLSHNDQLPLPPASMSKLMTLNMVFEALEDGRLSLETRLPVSAHAMSFGGSTMFLTTRDRVSVEDLIRGIVVLSGNDASVVFAEALSPDGTEEGFATMMTERARQLGMENSTFRNASGWPAPGHVMSMRDLGILAERLITEFPQYYTYFAETEFPFDGRAPDNRFNRNPLLTLDIGADGLKTGHTQEAGFGLVGSAVQGNRRVTFVITGMETAGARAREAERIVNWAFRQFAEREVVAAGDVVVEAEVFMGAAPTVGLTPTEDVTMLVPAVQDGGIEAEVVYQGPIAAPVEAGTELGTLVVRMEGFDDRRIPLVAAETVERGGIGIRLGTAARSVLRSILGDGPAPAPS